MSACRCATNDSIGRLAYMRRMKLRKLLWLIVLGASISHAETITGRVIAIADGDTLTVLVARQQVKVRLADIDAPESKQAFGSRSKRALSDLCFGKDAKL